jgi:NAD+ synthase
VSSPNAPPLDTELAERVLVAFLRDEAKRAGFDRLVLGLSGGVDSAVAAMLAAKAVGADRVHALALPARESSPESLAHAKLVAAAGGFSMTVKEIGPAAETLIASLEGGGPGPRPSLTPLRRGNVYARLRMIAIYDASAALPALVVGTSNKTELLLGYGTLHGDLACALNPLGDLYKCQVRELARRLGVPAVVIDKPPSADLWPGQTDEADLGFTYAEADALLFRLVDQRMSPDELVAAGFAEPLVRRVTRLVMRNQFKRRPPMIAKLSARTIGWEFRYPRDWGT